MVAGNTALAVIQNAALEAQADAARSAVASNRDILNLLRQRQALGAVGAADVAAQEARRRPKARCLRWTARSPPTAAPCRCCSASRRARPRPASLDTLTLPADLPLSLPSDLVATRPDAWSRRRRRWKARRRT
jgi:outer membrane protein TolC